MNKKKTVTTTEVKLSFLIQLVAGATTDGLTVYSNNAKDQSGRRCGSKLASYRIAGVRDALSLNSLNIMCSKLVVRPRSLSGTG